MNSPSGALFYGGLFLGRYGFINMAIDVINLFGDESVDVSGKHGSFMTYSRVGRQ